MFIPGVLIFIGTSRTGIRPVMESIKIAANVMMGLMALSWMSVVYFLIYRALITLTLTRLLKEMQLPITGFTTRNVTSVFYHRGELRDLVFGQLLFILIVGMSILYTYFVVYKYFGHL